MVTGNTAQSVDKIKKYSRDYEKFAKEIVADLEITGQEIKLRSTSDSWKVNGVQSNTRQFVDVGPFRREVTADLMNAYVEHINGASPLEVRQKVVEEIGAALSAKETHEFLMSKPIEIIPRDASCLPICLDNGESLKAYHKSIGYISDKDQVIKTAEDFDFVYGVAEQDDCKAEDSVNTNDDYWIEISR